MTVTTGTVDADYSQIELHTGDGGQVHDGQDLGLATVYGDDDTVTLAVPREYGPAQVTVEVVDDAPPLDPRWDTAVELSWRAGVAPAVTGWAGTGSVPVPVRPDVELRARYVVIGGQQEKERWGSDTGTASQDAYLLQVWPAPPAPGAVVRATVPWSQYWAWGPEAERTVAALAHVPDPARLDAVVDAALRAHPDVLDHLRAGRTAYRSGVVRYAQALFRVTHAAGTYRTWSADPDRLARLVDDRVRALP